MKGVKMRLFLISLVFLLTATLSYADTPVIGFIGQDTVWTRAGSPYVSLGSVVVKEGATLTIEPGVAIKFDSGHGLIIEGTLIARGTAEDMIEFSAKESKARGAWEGILFEDSSVNAEFDEAGNYLSGSILQYCMVEFAKTGVEGRSASPFISHSRISNNGGSGISIYDARIVVIKNSAIKDNDGRGIYIIGGDVILTGNTIEGNRRGIEVSDSNIVTISNNTINGNEVEAKIFWGSYELNSGAYGGGVFISGCNTVTLSDNNIAENMAKAWNGYGGGVYLAWTNTITISNNNIVRNVVSDHGGGVYLRGGTSITISNNNIAGNAAEGAQASWGGWLFGGGMYVYPESGSSIIINSNTLIENIARPPHGKHGYTAYGGGILIYYGHPYTVPASTAMTISNNTFTGNTATDAGGGIYVAFSVATTISNNIFTGNMAGSGGGVYIQAVAGNTATTISENTFTGNTAGKFGGGIFISIDAEESASNIGSKISHNSLTANSGHAAAICYYFEDFSSWYGHYPSEEEISGNSIVNNVNGSSSIYILGNPSLTRNTIVDNQTTYDLVYEVRKGLTDLDATNNYWGVTSETEIRARIYDFFQDNNLAVVDVTPFLTEPPSMEEIEKLLDGQPPVASFTHSPQIEEFLSGQEIVFKADQSENIISYEWIFGDDKTDVGPVVRHRFKGIPDQPTIYTVTLTVEDNTDYTDTCETDITVVPIEKTAEIAYKTIGEPTTIGAKVLYNWVGVDHGKDIYKVSKIDTWNHYFVGYYVVSIEGKDRTLWKKRIIIGPPFWRSYSPENLTVHASDWVSVRAYGVTEAQLLYWIVLLRGAMGDEIFGDEQIKLLFTKSATTYLAPDYVDTSEFLPIDEEDMEIAALTIGHIGSSAELRVYDSQGRVTGLVNGEVKQEIPNSGYFSDTFIILSSDNSYRYEVAGTDEGTYGLGVVSVENGEASTFVADDIPTSPQTIHQYIADWDALSKGGKGITVRVDTDGDGLSEQTVLADNELTQNEYLSAIGVEPNSKYPATWGSLKQTALFQNYPNPFNPDTWIPFTLAEQTQVTIRIHNAAGQLLRTLDLGNKPAGFYTSKEKAAYWDGCDNTGESVASGVYFYTLHAGSFQATKKMATAE